MNAFKFPIPMYIQVHICNCRTRNRVRLGSFSKSQIYFERFLLKGYIRVAQLLNSSHLLQCEINQLFVWKFHVGNLVLSQSCFPVLLARLRALLAPARPWRLSWSTSKPSSPKWSKLPGELWLWATTKQKQPGCPALWITQYPPSQSRQQTESVSDTGGTV